jgi:limonene-1,2-epoxide hydrolase
MTTLDDETKAKYCDNYRSFMAKWTKGTFDIPTIKEEVRKYMADNVVIKNADLPKIEGLDAWIASMDMWDNTLALVHDIQHIWCTDDGWVNAIIIMSYTDFNVGKAKIVAITTPGMNRAHINEESKIDLYESYWDTSALLPKLA